MSNEVNRFVCARVRWLRRERRLRVVDMAERSGIPLGSYSCLETGRYRMSLENLLRVLLALRADVTDVWPGTVVVSGPVTPAILRQVIRDAEATLPERVTVQDILRTVAEEHGVSVEALKGPSRKRDLTEARVQAALLVRENRHITMNELARELGRDPSSFCHAIRRRSS